MQIRLSLFLGGIFIISCLDMKGQTLAFHHLNTSNGLSDNFSRAATVDQNGFLWIGTNEGLNVYNGNDIKIYTKEEFPELPSNNIQSLFNDSQNRLWLGCAFGSCWMDENRNFHKILLSDTLTRYSTSVILESQCYGVIVFANFGQHYLNPWNNHWEQPAWLPKEIVRLRVKDAQFVEDDYLIMVHKDGMIMVDYNTGKKVLDYPCTGPVSITYLNNGIVALGFESGLIQFIDIHSGKPVKEIHLFPHSPGNAVQPRISQIRSTPQRTLVVATGNTGLVTIDSAGTIHSYIHDPIDPVSLNANNINKTWVGKDGEIVALSSSSGVSIGNINYKRAGFTKVFRDPSGHLYDNYFNEIAVDAENRLWLCGYDRLIRWDRKKKESRYFQYFSRNGSVAEGMEFRALCFDGEGKIWLSVVNEGLVVFDPIKEQFTPIIPDTSLGKIAAATYIHDLLYSSDGTIWACSNDGFFTVNPKTKKIQIYKDDPVLKVIAKQRTTGFLEEPDGKLWLAVTPGLYCYDRKNGELSKYSTLDSLVSANCYGLYQARNGAIYVASLMGFSVIEKGRVTNTVTRENGLKYDRVESFEEDLLGNIWVSNNRCLVKYDPVNRSLQYFDENAGINTSGFRFDGSCVSVEGELFWAPQNGINYFYPEQLLQSTAPLKVSVYALELKDTTYYLGSDVTYEQKFARNKMTFYIAAINLSGSGEVNYQYKLDGYDEDWKTEEDIHKVDYAGLAPGEYAFHLRASSDGVNWTMANTVFKVKVLAPLWLKWWFVLGFAGLFFGIIGWVVSMRAKKLRERNEALETELAISYFASGLQNHQQVESILWDVANNSISRLHLEDCVIYLLDHDTEELHQVAAHGPKTLDAFEIHQPIKIPLGKGIVGSVALSGKAEIINNTEKDPRYIVDDQRRYSEIAVPIISGGKVLGVIDSEHSRKNFFTQKHLSMLTTIASLCANTLVRAQAEEEKLLAELTLVDTRKKMSEVEMQALRAQMNPHFIFNCLNSINRYIVKSDQVTASLYLTRFAKLIRLILDNSNSQNVILSNELEALRLYIEMESLRFDKKFEYKIHVSDNVNPDTIELPPLMIQPYVENAIWHGLLHKPDEGKLSVNLDMIEEGLLQIVVEDNGVGRQKALELKSKSATNRKSLGMKLTDDRLALLNKDTDGSASIQIIDLKNGSGEASGTRVVFTIPVN